MRDLSVHFVLSLISRQERSPVKNKRAQQLKTTETGSKGDGGLGFCGVWVLSTVTVNGHQLCLGQVSRTQKDTVSIQLRTQA